MEEDAVSQYEVIVDEQALNSVSESLNTYILDYKEMLEDAIRKLKLNSDDWNDEDFNSLLSAINSFMADVDRVGKSTSQLMKRINEKIVAIHELHNMKI